ncbi:MAG TPA: TRL-like family protein [Nitrospira sp.]|nr:TRL-like family protein [Nitrospira sp.]
MMIRIVFVMPLIMFLLVTAGCMGEASPVIGRIYTDVQYGMFATTATDASKRGESCAKSVLTLFATGDATVTTAKNKGGITQVAAVEHASFNLLGIYSSWCTIVKGN